MTSRWTWDRDCEQLYREHASRVRGLARLLLRDAEEAQDVVQDVFAKAALALRSTEPPRDWRAWLTRVAVNTCHSRARGSWWRRFRQHVDPLEAYALRDESPRPDTVLQGREVRDRVWLVFRELPQRQQEVFALRHLEGWSTADVADALGITDGAVKTHLARAVHRLRAALGDAR